MANPHHLKLLHEGPGAWNKWRATNFSEAPDLSRADLSSAKLGLMDFQEVDLSGANLEGADLSFSKFIWTDLEEAKLTGANLRSACFGEANLRNADLRRSDLSYTVFNDSTLDGANLARAICQETYFTHVDLSTCIGLEQCDHWGESNLSLGTLVASKNLPQQFLEGCGIGSYTLEHLSELNGRSGRFYSCFISYSHEDQEFARRLHSDLRASGVRCWFAPESMRAGRKVRRQIDQALGEHDKLLLVLSQHSMKSSWVEYEVRRARAREVLDTRRVFFPIALVPFSSIRTWQLFCSEEGRDLASEIREYYVPDFSSWLANEASYQASFKRLLADLSSSVEE